MRINEVISESISQQVYHYAPLDAAFDILQSGTFKLSHSVGSKIEQGLTKVKYPYYMSVTRTLLGAFHQTALSGVLFNLNGDYFNKNYHGSPVDFHHGTQKHKGYSEAEDRIFSAEPEIPSIPAIKSIHILYNPQAVSPLVRKILILAKQHNIPHYVYHEQDAWKIESPSGRIPLAKIINHLNTKTREQPYIEHPNNSKLPLWNELIRKNEFDHLTEPAKFLLVDLISGDPRYGNDMGLGYELTHARMPTEITQDAKDIVEFKRKYRLETTKDILFQLYKKWNYLTNDDDIMTQYDKSNRRNRSDDQQHYDTMAKTGFWGAQGAGCIFKASDTGRYLIAQRSKHVQEPLTWGTWGGAMDQNENPKYAVTREVKEETGYDGEFKIKHLWTFVAPKGNFKYHNFLVIVPYEFEPTLNWENSSYEWCEYGKWPTPLHFGFEQLIANSSLK